MSAHLTDQDCINALATFWYEYHKQPRNEAPQQALERAFIIAQEEVSTKEDYFERMNDLSSRATKLIEALILSNACLSFLSISVFTFGFMYCLSIKLIELF